MPAIDFQTAIMWGTIYGGVILVVAWLAMIIWAYKDMRARSRDAWAQILVAVVIFFLNFAGLLIYIFLRPRETLAEAYERSLEEEALLQEIEAKPNCPGCGNRVEHDWQACPHCHTRLKKPCIRCGKMLQLSWNLCPHCATPQTSGASNVHAHVSRSVRAATSQTAPDADWKQDLSYGTTSSAGSSQLEFVDEEY